MMALIQDASQRGLDLRWDQAAKQVDPDCSGDALKQQLNKRREKLIAEGAQFVPLSASRTRRTHRTTSHASDTGNGGMQSPLSELSRSDPVADAVPKALGLRITSKRARELTSESDGESETKINRNSDCEESVDDGAIEDSDDSDWASKKLPKKKARKVISGQASKATRTLFKAKRTTATESLNNRGAVLGAQSTGRSRESNDSPGDRDNLAYATEQTTNNNQAKTTTPAERTELRKSLIVALKSSGGRFINLANHSELTKMDRYNYANLPYPNDLANEEKKAIYDVNPAFALACGNKDDIRLNNFATPGYEDGMSSIGHVLNSTTSNQYSGYPMMSSTQSSPIGPGDSGMLSQTPQYRAMVNNADASNHSLDFGQNGVVMPQSQSTSSGYPSPGYFQQGLTSGQRLFQLRFLSIFSINRKCAEQSAISMGHTYDFPMAHFPTPKFDDGFKPAGEVPREASTADGTEATGSFGNLESQISTTLPSTPRRNRKDTGASIPDTMSPTDMSICTLADTPQSPVPKIEAGRETHDGHFATVNSSLDGFSMGHTQFGGMGSLNQADFDAANWFSFGD